MKVFMFAVGVLLLSAVISGPTPAQEEAVDFCTCVHEPRDTEARREACGDIFESLSDEEFDAQSMACRAALPMPAGGPDICFCLKGLVTDPEIAQICDTFVSDDMSREEVEAIAEQCGLEAPQAPRR